ncbi:MAG: hypothetical protein QOJ13_3447 [Gaiellales bacterium]|jgi:hypothetical protein|nr:hypothetical protein [Gaiellales bacterium]
MSVSTDPTVTHREDLPWPHEPPDTTPAPVPVLSAPVVEAVAGFPIGRLRRADPVELWRSADFATWLGANLAELGTLIGMKLTPAPAGAASPGTVVATDPEGGQVRVVVELGSSSDETFGLLMRQLVASGAKTAIWVCARAQDEHLTSVEWLNREITGRLHVVVLEAVRIDDSVPAPVFRLALRAGDGPPLSIVPAIASA